MNVTLSRRNLLTLLSKLDRKAAGEETLCTIIKYDPEMAIITAVEDKECYKDRNPGRVLPADEPQCSPTT